MTDRSLSALDNWKGTFGESYIGRASLAADATTREAVTVFARILDTAGIRGEVSTILEVGANIGINLSALRQFLNPAVRLSAVEPNATACEMLRKRADLRLDDVFECDASQLPVPDGAYDLTFTNGVLIHVPPDRLQASMKEIVRASRRYVLCSEYFSHTPEEIVYHGKTGLLWKRDFGAAYLEWCPELKPVAYGFLWQREFPHFDDLTWWLFEKVKTA